MGLSIGDVEKITGISKDRLRYYEEKNLIIPERNEENRYRTYELDEILKLFGIQLYRAMDMGVKEIQSIQESASLPEMQAIFEKRQEKILTQIAELQEQNEYIAHCINDCDKIRDHLNRISIQRVTGFILKDRLESSLQVDEYDKFRDSEKGQKIIIRNFVRRIELTPEGIGENAVFVLEEDDSKEVECVYTIVAEDSEHDPMMETYVKCMQWISENAVCIDRYCYVRPLMISNIGNTVGSYLEIFAPIKKST